MRFERYLELKYSTMHIVTLIKCVNSNMVAANDINRDSIMAELRLQHFRPGFFPPTSLSEPETNQT